MAPVKKKRNEKGSSKTKNKTDSSQNKNKKDSLKNKNITDNAKNKNKIDSLKNKISMKRKRNLFMYPEEALSQAIQAIKNQNMGIREACRLFSVPRSTVQDRISGRVLEQRRRVGPEPILGFDGEEKVVNWIIELAKCGIPINKEVLLETVKKIMNDMGKGDKLPEGKRPGQTWYQNFLRRHPEISVREPESINKAREAVKESTIRKWFSDLEFYLIERGQIDIMEDPDRILNADETGVSLCPNTGKVLAPKGYKNVYVVKKGNEKETLTVLITMTASGKICPPLVVFPYIRPPKAVVENMPEGWIIGKTETGWMRSDVFYEYIANDFNNWLQENNVKKPVILFVDGHKSHMSMPLSQFCEENDIILYALPPNTTHITQPADVSVFRPLKQEWKKTLRNWQAKPENYNSTVTKTNFCKVFKETLDKDMAQTIRNGFRKCGLFPLNVEAVDFTKCVKDFQERRKRSSSSGVLTERDYISAQKVVLSIKDNLLKNGIDPDIVHNEIELAKSSFKEKRRSTSKTPRTTPRTSTEVAKAFKTPEQNLAHEKTKKPNSVPGDGAADNEGCSLLDDISIPDVGSYVSLNDISVIKISDINFDGSDATQVITVEDVHKDVTNYDIEPLSPQTGNSAEMLHVITAAEINQNKDNTKNIDADYDTLLDSISSQNENISEMAKVVRIAEIHHNKDITENLDAIDILPLTPPPQTDTTKRRATAKMFDETPASENVINLGLVNTSSNKKDTLIDPFEKHLKYPHTSTETKTKRRNIHNLPSAISDKAWRNHYQLKEKEKQTKIDEKNKRKIDREQKKSEQAPKKRKIDTEMRTKNRKTKIKNTSDKKNNLTKSITKKTDKDIEKTDIVSKKTNNNNKELKILKPEQTVGEEIGNIEQQNSDDLTKTDKDLKGTETKEEGNISIEDEGMNKKKYEKVKAEETKEKIAIKGKTKVEKKAEKEPKKGAIDKNHSKELKILKPEQTEGEEIGQQNSDDITKTDKDLKGTETKRNISIEDEGMNKKESEKVKAGETKEKMAIKGKTKVEKRAEKEPKKGAIDKNHNKELKILKPEQTEGEKIGNIELQNSNDLTKTDMDLKKTETKKKENISIEDEGMNKEESDKVKAEETTEKVAINEKTEVETKGEKEPKKGAIDIEIELEEDEELSIF